MVFSGGGGGTEDNPYRITHLEHLMEIGEGRKYYILMRDLDFQDDSHYLDLDNKPLYTTGSGFSPVIFGGNFDGNKHVIRNYYSQNNSLFRSASGTPYVVIHHVGLENVHIDVTGVYVGGFINEVNIDPNNHIHNCYVTGYVKGTGITSSFVGGFAALFQNGLLENCWADCEVIGFTSFNQQFSSTASGFVSQQGYTIFVPL